MLIKDVEKLSKKGEIFKDIPNPILYLNKEINKECENYLKILIEFFYKNDKKRICPLSNQSLLSKLGKIVLLHIYDSDIEKFIDQYVDKKYYCSKDEDDEYETEEEYPEDEDGFPDDGEEEYGGE